MSDLDQHSSSSTPVNPPSDVVGDPGRQRPIIPAVAAVPETMMSRSGKIIPTLSGRGRGRATTSSPGRGRKRKRTLILHDSDSAEPSETAPVGGSEQAENTPPKVPKGSHTLEGLWKYTAHSILTAPMLEEIRAFWFVPANINMYIPSPFDTYDIPAEEKRWVISSDAFRWGLRLPASSFINEFFHKTDRAPSQLLPNGWVILTSFQVVCAAAGIPATMDLFLRFFYIKHDGVVSAIFPRGRQYFLKKMQKNNLGRFFRPWLLVDGGFKPDTPTQFAAGYYPVPSDYPGVSAHVQALRDIFDAKIPAAVYLDEEVLAKAGLSKARAPSESLGILSPFVHVYTFCTPFTSS